MRFLPGIIFLLTTCVVQAAIPEWKSVRSEHAVIYFQKNSEIPARQLAGMMDSEYLRITDQIGYPPHSEVVVVLSPSEDETQHASWLIDSLKSENESNRIYLSVTNSGSFERLKRDILTQWSVAIVEEMMSGSNLINMYSNRELRRLPDWFVYGAALYVANADDLQDFSRLPNKPDRLRGEEAALVGQTFWNFVYKEYGKNAMANILNYARIIRDEEKSLAITVGIPYEKIMKDWREFYAVR